MQAPLILIHMSFFIRGRDLHTEKYKMNKMNKKNEIV